MKLYYTKYKYIEIIFRKRIDLKKFREDKIIKVKGYETEKVVLGWKDGIEISVEISK